jgi:hypothetical protein
MTTILSKKSAEYSCETCQYITRNKFDFSKHLLTAKHLKNNIAEKITTSKKYICKCGKDYNDRAGLWRHKKKCETIVESSMSQNVENKSQKDKDEMAIMMTVVKDLLHNNHEVQTKLFELLKESGNMINSNNTNNINNSTNNNRFNLNFFLNEQCKDAMNLMDFVKSLEINLQDVENVGKLGYVEGISNIILNGLNKLDVYQRPIHCSDLKRESVHIKDENIWELDKDKKIFTSAIKHVACKNVKKISDWKTENPQWNDFDSKVHEIYSKMLYESMGPTTPEDKIKYFGRIINNISKEVTIDKGK